MTPSNPDGSFFLALHGRLSSIVLECSPTEAPIWRHWGARLADSTLPFSALRQTRPQPPASLEFDQPLSIAPTFGAGWFGKAALLAHCAGRNFTHQWQSCAHVGNADGIHIFTLSDAVAALRLVIQVKLDPMSDVLTIKSTLHNVGNELVEVQWLAAATLPLPSSANQIQYTAGEWANEFEVEVIPLSRGTWVRENTRGRTSHDCFPGAVVRCLGATEHHGNVYGAHLGWSGNHSQSIEWQHDGQYQWQLGEFLAPGEVRLQPGDSLESPASYAAFSPSGLNGLAQCFHSAVNQLTPWHGGKAMPRPRPVHLNTWEAVYFDHREADLMALASSAAALGVERFVLDDGWFHLRRHDGAGLGDWWPDREKYPNGLGPLASHVRACGMSFGLWVEPEMVNADSDLYRAHPEWVLQVEGRPQLTGRNQLVLDLTQPAVSDYLFASISGLLSTLPIEYLKWDMNRDLALAGSNGSAAYRKQVLALYGLLEKVNQEFPTVEIENCASGGGRIDFGMMRHTHRVWLSDCNDALSRVAIQRGAMQWLPPALLGAHVGAAPSHTTGRSQSLAFRAAVALGAHFGVEMDVRKLDYDERTHLSKWIALFKKIRDRLHNAGVWLGDAGDGVVWQAHGESTSVILLIYRLTPSAQRYAPKVRLPMLDPTHEYFAQRLDPHDSIAAAGNDSAMNTNLSNGLTISGGWLIHDGLPLPRLNAESAIVFSITAID